MIDHCGACKHANVRKYIAAFKNLQTAVKDLSSKEENKDGTFTIDISCKYCDKDHPWKDV